MSLFNSHLLCMRAKNILMDHDIHEIDQLKTVNLKELFGKRAIGEQTLFNMLEFMKLHGIDRTKEFSELVNEIAAKHKRNYSKQT